MRTIILLILLALRYTFGFQHRYGRLVNNQVSSHFAPLLLLQLIIVNITTVQILTELFTSCQDAVWQKPHSVGASP